jgi:hypothetical protein
MTRTITTTRQASIEALWKSTPTSDRRSNPELFTALPSTARRYLERAIAPDTPLASAVRLWMHGDIKLGQRWHHFRGEEVICWNRGMIWRATTWMRGLPIWGADRLVNGLGDMQWKILGLFPVMQASGDDITRSGVGRVQGESVWLPSVLCQPDILWTELNGSQVQANFTTLGEPAHLTLTVSEAGRLECVKFERWGNPDGEAYHYVDFGVKVEESGMFEGYTIPTRIRAGWFFGSDRFESEGEFFRCTIDKAIYR